MVDAIHLATWRRLAVVLCLSAAALGCGGPKQPTSPTAAPNTASATGYNPSGAHNALLGPNELLSAGQGFLFTIRLPKGFKPDPASKAGDLQWRGPVQSGRGKYAQTSRVRMRIGATTAGGTAESEANLEIGRLGQQEYQGFQAGTPIKISLGGSAKKVEFLRTGFTFTDKIFLNQVAEVGPGAGFLYTGVVDGKTIHIDSDELSGGPANLEIADAAARSFAVSESFPLIKTPDMKKPSFADGVQRALDRQYLNIPNNKPVIHRTEAGDPGPDGWCVAESTRGSFSVKVPGKFSDSMVKSRTTTGGIGVMHTIARKTADGTEFSVLETEAIGERPPAAGDFVQRMIDEYRKKGAQVKRSETTLAGVRADRLSVEAKGVGGEIVLVTVADRDYMLGVQWRPPARAGLSDDVERFFKSFEVKRKPEPTKPADSGAKVP
jgi:hypothetical protein